MFPVFLLDEQTIANQEFSNSIVFVPLHGILLVSLLRQDLPTVPFEYGIPNAQQSSIPQTYAATLLASRRYFLIRFESRN